MRLVCPNCGAQYEVPAEVISSEGRDVQCSNCGITWFQPGPEAADADPERPDTFGDGADDFIFAEEPEDRAARAEGRPERAAPVADEAGDDAAYDDGFYDEEDEPAGDDGFDEEFGDEDAADDFREPDEDFGDVEADTHREPDEGFEDAYTHDDLGEDAAADGDDGRRDDFVDDDQHDPHHAYDEPDADEPGQPRDDVEDDFAHGPEEERYEADDEYEEDLAAVPPPDPALAAAVTGASLGPEADDSPARDRGEAPEAPPHLDEDDALDADFPEDGYPGGDAPEAVDPDDTPPAGPARVVPRRPLSPDVQSVLRAEAAFEASVRARTADPLESQPDLGLGEPETPVQRRERESRERLNRLRGMTSMAAAKPAGPEVRPAPPSPPRPPAAAAPQPKPQPGPGEPLASAEGAPRRDLLPDIEEINSSLGTKGLKRSAPAGDTPEVDTRAQRRGFRLGFGLMLLLAAALILYYMHAGWVSETFPALADTTDAYVEAADSFRVWLDDRARQLHAWVEGISE